MRAALIAAGLVLLAPFVAPAQEADQGRRTHAIAMHGEPKYPPDFPHFDYVNPDAPKGGTLRLAAEGTYDSFNAHIARGTAASISSIYETLLTSSADEPFTEYGLLAESIEMPEDRSWVAFTLRPEARWHDGQPVTVEDVIWSLETLKTHGAPFYRFYYQAITAAEKVGERTVRFAFAPGDNREMPLIAGQFPILPRHWWEGRDFSATTLERPLGSGPYRIGAFEPGRFVELQRVADYWGETLPVNVGQNNFDRIRIDYFRDATVIRQAVRAGNIDWRMENQAKAWAVDYDTPAVARGLLRKVEFPNERPTGMQAFVLNTRRAQFEDARVRRALAYAFDFEWTNQNLFFGAYARTESFFSNSELAADSLPEGEELEILERYRGRVPDQVFTQVYRAPATDGSGWPRENLKRALELLAEAGWVVRDMRLINEATGQQMRFEFLLSSQAFERIVLPYIRNLARLGIDASARLVDQSQYVNRVRSYDFDVIVGVWGQSRSPGNEQGEYWGSDAADRPSSRNLIGVRDPVVDDLIALIIAAPTRESLVARTRALDRVLLWNHYVVPNWYNRTDRIVFWDKFGYPETIPDNGTSTSWWWFDEARAARIARGLAADPDLAVEAGAGNDRGGFMIWLFIAGGLMAGGWLAVRRAMR
ncbi:MAG: extracellular solute-binding protein [Alphaproteobacteria bacterium]